jgi:hypothetical protein
VAQQKAFDDTRSKAEMAAAQGRVKEKEAELAAITELLGRIEVRAERDGIAVFGDPNDWLGRPVQTGERVMQLADPAMPAYWFGYRWATPSTSKPAPPCACSCTPSPLPWMANSCRPATRP